ncbi:negative transcription regulator [Phialemonium atrogriseum]|uniref:Mediator of RNA polymerase II transcription subunit 10 n=1 Tax=Phialemonium atrogriseum TaxID=1093897 RepID=A0AAJ0BY99_9PEZI|nr:negative transcription regulator [Phialemonium atrogriseum]KAK1765633.1 negative transcription regulator [Phialemonium atrogriseum]
MEPIDKPDHNLVEQQVKDVIQDLFQVMVQVSSYDAAGRPSREVLANELQTLSESLRSVHTAASSLPPGGGPRVPDLLVQYVENGRNPDIYTREFVERVRRMNQLARGKMRAFAAFRDVLAAQMDAALPELRGDVGRVVEATGGRGEAEGERDGAGAGDGDAPGPGAGAGMGGFAAPGGRVV